MIWVHTPTPVAFSVMNLSIRWYSLAYLFTLLFFTFYTWRRSKSLGMVFKKKLFFDPFFTHICLGVIVGGRLGHVLFFDPQSYMKNPLLIFALWEGGMSFHGGAVGALLQSWYTARHNPPLTWGFLASCASFIAPLGLFLGRCANYLNGELVGVPTDGTWGVIFAMHDTQPRHPVQLYESLCEGPLLWLTLYLARRHLTPRSEWDTTVIFTINYCVIRFFIEFFKEHDRLVGPLALEQVYCIAFAVSAALLYAYTLRKKR